MLKRGNYPQTFLPLGSDTILVFPYQTLWQFSYGDPLTGRRMQRGGRNRDFRPISHFISEMIQNRDTVIME